MSTAAHTSQLGMTQLRFFAPFQALGDDQLILLSSKIRLDTAPEGQHILPMDTTDTHQYFLLDGVVELEGRDGMRHVVEGGTEKSRQPLAPARPGDHQVVSLSPVRLIKIEGELLQALEEHGRIAEQETGADVPCKDSEIYQAIKRDLRENRFVLPSLPEIALRIRKAIEGEGANLDKVAKLVNADPAIAAKLIKAANGPLYRGNVPIESSQGAIVRLGTKATRQLVISFTMRDLFKVKDTGLKKRLHEVWRHSTEIGALCFVLARLTPDLEPEHAMLAGLVHDIGVVPILNYAQQHPEMLADRAALEQVSAELRGEIGAMILRRWGFSESLAQAALHADDWHYDSGARADYCDLVIIAQLHSTMQNDSTGQYPDMETLPAFAKLAPDKLDSKTRLKVLDAAKAQVNEAIRLLTA